MRPGPPLCPAGHLPLKGGDRTSRRLSLIPNAAGWTARPKQPISPLEGEMSGRTEGGLVERCYRKNGRDGIA
ncbi:lytic murein transglycosylase [Mesorhizobium sp. B1-1-5]|nr:lytic murein transglycosylase [Mesorhizobium sp. B1-1-5]